MNKPTVVQLIHNPGAGAKNVTKQQLLEALQAAGWDCRYSSTKDEWEIDPEAGMIIIAGGDGTVRKAVARVINRARQPVFAILPLGTANNIATSFRIGGNIEEVINNWSNGKTYVQRTDAGILNQALAEGFFLEAVGYGVFPQMIQDMQNRKKPSAKTPAENLQSSLQALHDIVLSYEPRYCYMEADGEIYSGRFLLLEIMNIRSIGPNLYLAPGADAGDGQLQVVMARAHEKEKLAAYLWHKLQHNEDICLLQTVKAKHIKLQWYGTHLHADDTLLAIPVSAELEIGIREGALHFIAGNE